MQSWCQTSTWLTTYRSCLCVRVRPCHLTFPLSLILQTLLATRYWFFILLNISLPLIEFTPDYQCFKEASPPLTVLPVSSHPQSGHTRRLPSISFSCEFSTREWRHGNWQYRQKWSLCQQHFGQHPRAAEVSLRLFYFFPPTYFKMVDNREWWVIYDRVETCPPPLTRLYYILQELV